MPFTFFAHQVPVVPIKRRWPDRWDGLGLVVGSIMPDLWYVTHGWLYGPAGIALWVDAHHPDQFVVHNLLVGCLLTVILRRVVAPVVPLAMPDLPPFHLHDYQLLMLSRHRWWVTAYSVAVGALTHLLVDGFTHADQFGVEWLPWLGETLFTVASYDVAPYKLLQYLGHTLGTAVGVWMAWRLGRDRALRHSLAHADLRGLPTLSDRGVRVVRRILSASVVAAAAYAVVRIGDSMVASVMAFVWVVIAGSVVAGVVGRRELGASDADLPAPLDPVVE